MLGYVTVNRDQLSPGDYQEYRTFYCGLCRVLDKKYGQAGRLTLNYDMTFLYLLLTSLYEPETQRMECRCTLHPVKHHSEAFNPMADYCADMNILLAYYDLLDDWEDERRLAGRAGAAALKKGRGQVEQQYPRQAEAVRTYIRELHHCEEEDSDRLDEASGLSGTMLGEIILYREDEWASLLREMGFYLGKFIYLCDAYEDLEKDLKAGRYNPWKSWKDHPEFHKEAEDILQSVMGQCARSFEKLPLVENIEIMRNILYSGIWARFEIAGRKRERNRKS